MRTSGEVDLGIAWPDPGSRHDAALGAVLGALAGDAAGAVLEFQPRPTTVEVERALRFPGGGIWGVAPGQVTDDGELTLCLLHALGEARDYVPDVVARWYGRWFNSPPFDMGSTTGQALAPARTHPADDPTGLHERMTRAARTHNTASRANGSLMRATPLGVWGHALEDAQLAAIARLDSATTHPNPACTDAVAAYAIAVASLVRSPGDRTGAHARVRAWVDASACDEVRTWLDEAERDVQPPYEPQAGFVRIGFTAAFRHLLAGRAWEGAVRETLLGGGDTDTNACIVGGLVGAADGASGVPLAARTAVLRCNHAKGKARPGWLHPREGVAAIGDLLAGNSAP